MAIFNCYVSSPEGNWLVLEEESEQMVRNSPELMKIVMILQIHCPKECLQHFRFVPWGLISWFIACCYLDFLESVEVLKPA